MLVMLVWELICSSDLFIEFYLYSTTWMDSYLGTAHVADPSLDQIAHHHRRDWDACGRENTCNSKNILIG